MCKRWPVRCWNCRQYINMKHEYKLSRLTSSSMLNWQRHLWQSTRHKSGAGFAGDNKKKKNGDSNIKDRNFFGAAQVGHIQTTLQQSLEYTGCVPRSKQNILTTSRGYRNPLNYLSGLWKFTSRNQRGREDILKMARGLQGTTQGATNLISPTS